MLSEYEVPARDARGNILCANCGHTLACDRAYGACDPERDTMTHVCVEDPTLSGQMEKLGYNVKLLVFAIWKHWASLLWRRK